MESMQSDSHPAIDSGPGDLLRRSLLFREYCAEREEILRYKWIESEKAGQDIGFERALMGWMVRHRAPWRRTRRVHVGP